LSIIHELFPHQEFRFIILWLINYCSWLFTLHYQKIDKYKRKYRKNISVGKFPRDFTGENISSVYTEGITMGKKLKQSKKKNDDVSFLPTELPTKLSVIPSVNLLVKIWTLFIMSITKRITDEIVRRYFLESFKTVHFPIALLIVVLYGQDHRRIEKSSVLFGGFLKKFN
jgi:hypothetical protein